MRFIDEYFVESCPKEFKRVKIFNQDNWSCGMSGEYHNFGSVIDFIVDTDADEVLVYHMNGPMPKVGDVMSVLFQDRHVRKAIESLCARNVFHEYIVHYGQSGHEYWTEKQWFVSMMGDDHHHIPHRTFRSRNNFMEVTSSEKLDFHASERGCVRIPLAFLKWQMVKEYERVQEERFETGLKCQSFIDWYRNNFSKKAVKSVLRNNGVRIKYFNNRNNTMFCEAAKANKIMDLDEYKFEEEK